MNCSSFSLCMSSKWNKKHGEKNIFLRFLKIGFPIFGPLRPDKSQLLPKEIILTSE